MSKNAGWILHRGVHSVHIGVLSAVTLTHRGRPEPESGTPVNMENRLHRDNGEGVAATPPPYPLDGRGRHEVVLWPDTFNNYFHPWVAQAAIEVLEDAGFSVVVPKQNMCCG